MSQRTTRTPRTAEAAVDRLEKLYADATAGLSAALDRYLSVGEPPSAAERATFRYPLLRVVHRDLDRPAPTHRRAFGRLQRPGVYETTITHPRAFRRYLLEQLNPLLTEYGARIEVAVSDQEIPYPYVLERADEITGGNVTAADLARHFPTPQLSDGGRRDRRRPVGAARGRAAAAVAVRCGARRLLAAPPGALHGQRLAPCAAVDPAHQLSPLCRPVHPLGPRSAGGPRHPVHAAGAAGRRRASSAAIRPSRPTPSSPATSGIVTRCRPITWSRRTARA